MRRNVLFICLLGLLAVLLLPVTTGCNSSSQDPLATDTTKSLVIQEWSKRISQYPENDEYRYKRGLELAKDKHLKLALNDMNQAIALDATKADYYIGRADVYMALQETKNALADYEKAVEVEPKHEKALQNLGQFYLFVRQFDNSLAVFKKLERVNPSNVSSYFYQGMAYKESGDTTAAIEQFGKAVQVDLLHYNSLIQLGQLYTELEDTLGLVYYRNATIADGFSDEAYYGLGLLYQRLGQLDSAIVNYQRTIDINAQHYLAFFNTGRIMFDQENWDRAIEHFRIAVKFAPDFAKGHFMLGLTNELRGSADQAIVHYERCLQVDPNFEKAKERLSALKT